MPLPSSLPGEFELISRYFAPLAAGFAGAEGLRDDAAVLSPSAGRQLVVATDAVVAGVHFNPDDPADLVVRKVLRVNLSDLAAKGAEPKWYMLNLLLPKEATEDWIRRFASGLEVDQRQFDIHLIGGDTNSTPGPLAVAVTAFGEIDRDRVLRRGGARVGVVVFVTGTIGDAALGLGALRGGLSTIDEDAANALIGRYHLPEPHTGIGPKLLGLATAALDVSDGLVADLVRLRRRRHLRGDDCAVRAGLRLKAVRHGPLARRHDGGDLRDPAPGTLSAGRPLLTSGQRPSPGSEHSFEDREFHKWMLLGDEDLRMIHIHARAGGS